LTSRTESSKISKSQVISVALGALNIIREYANELYQRKQTAELQNAILELDELEQRIQGKSKPLKTELEVDAHFQQVTNQILDFTPEISSQLHSFWNAHIEIATLAATSGRSYMPMKYAEDNREKILKVNERYTKVVEKMNKDPNDEISIYALFYVHNLRTEVIEHSFVAQFKELLTGFNLLAKYDPEEIFSVVSKVGKGKDWRTDARAVRDALSHNKFELVFSGSTWEIQFNNKKHGFKKTFTRSEFIQFNNHTDLLYRSTLMLIFGLIARTVIKQHLLVP